MQSLIYFSFLKISELNSRDNTNIIIINKANHDGGFGPVVILLETINVIMYVTTDAGVKISKIVHQELDFLRRMPLYVKIRIPNPIPINELPIIFIKAVINLIMFGLNAFSSSKLVCKNE